MLLLNSSSHILSTKNKLYEFDHVQLHLWHWSMGGTSGACTLFAVYTTFLGNTIGKHDLNFHFYADDIQLCISFQPGVAVSIETAISRLDVCNRDIKIWLTNNLMKSNDDKTELIVITTHSNTSQNQRIAMNIRAPLRTPSAEPRRDLRVLFDSCSLNAMCLTFAKS